MGFDPAEAEQLLAVIQRFPDTHGNSSGRALKMRYAALLNGTRCPHA